MMQPLHPGHSLLGVLGTRQFQRLLHTNTTLTSTSGAWIWCGRPQI
uniref:Uncharacterized protein n=1 Tax=Rhizophora mucronata TaxID=61149 RepID=A0A2P2J6V0_RHIMU